MIYKFESNNNFSGVEKTLVGWGRVGVVVVAVITKLSLGLNNSFQSSTFDSGLCSKDTETALVRRDKCLHQVYRFPGKNVMRNQYSGEIILIFI